MYEFNPMESSNRTCKQMSALDDEALLKIGETTNSYGEMRNVQIVTQARIMSRLNEIYALLLKDKK